MDTEEVGQQDYLHRASSAELFRCALDTLRLASSSRLVDVDPNTTVGSLRKIGDALDAALRAKSAGLAAHGRAGLFTAVDSPFEGDAKAASVAPEFWLERAGDMLTLGPKMAIDNAHITAGGLVQTAPR